MAKTVSIFFNNVNLQIYSQDETTGKIESVHLGDISTTINVKTPKGREEIHLVPAMVCYDDRIYYGQEVFTHKKFSSPATFKYMKQYISKEQYLPRIDPNITVLSVCICVYLWLLLNAEGTYG